MELNTQNLKKFEKQLGSDQLGKFVRDFITKWELFSTPYMLYEILSLKDGTIVSCLPNGTYFLPEQSVTNIPAYVLNKSIVTSVKRKSDNTVFSIGDNCYNLDLKGEIINIKIDGNGVCIIECDNVIPSGNNWKRQINQIDKY